jgi:hypothetical protein
VRPFPSWAVPTGSSFGKSGSSGNDSNARQRLGGVAIAGAEGALITLAVGAAFSILAAPVGVALFGGLAVGVGASIILDQLINPRILFPAFGLIPFQ